MVLGVDGDMVTVVNLETSRLPELLHPIDGLPGHTLLQYLLVRGGVQLDQDVFHTVSLFLLTQLLALLPSEAVHYPEIFRHNIMTLEW